MKAAQRRPFCLVGAALLAGMFLFGISIGRNDNQNSRLKIQAYSNYKIKKIKDDLSSASVGIDHLVFPFLF
jgi:hypothetical protein